jgi:hypothetical protein
MNYGICAAQRGWRVPSSRWENAESGADFERQMEFGKTKEKRKGILFLAWEDRSKNASN